MNKQPDNSAKEAKPLSPGELLCKAREAKNLSIDSVAKELLINKEYILGLEKDDYSKIAAPVYARGYLRAYAQFLQIPENIILASLNKSDWYKKNNPQNLAVLSPIRKIGKTKNKSSWLIYTIIAALIIGITLNWQKHKITAKNNITIPKITTSITNIPINKDRETQAPLLQKALNIPKDIQTDSTN